MNFDSIRSCDGCVIMNSVSTFNCSSAEYLFVVKNCCEVMSVDIDLIDSLVMEIILFLSLQETSPTHVCNVRPPPRDHNQSKERQKLIYRLY